MINNLANKNMNINRRQVHITSDQGPASHSAGQSFASCSHGLESSYFFLSLHFSSGTFSRESPLNTPQNTRRDCTPSPHLPEH